MTRLLAAAVAVALALLGLAATASAASLVYVKDHQLWISQPDGSGAIQVTRDGTADEPYSSPTMADDGTIAATKGFFVHLLRQNGELIRKFIPKNLENSTAGAHGLHFSPDGTKLSYAKVSPGCGPPECDLDGISAVMDLQGKTLAQEEEFTGGFPSWVTNDIVLSHGGYGYQNMLWRWKETKTFVNWFDDSDLVADGLSTDLGDGQLSDNHASYVAVRGYGDSTAIATYHVNGDLSAPNPPLPTFLCFATGTVSSPTVSGDGATAYWTEPDGVWTFAVSPDCPNGTLMIPGASEPDWSAAKVAPGPKSDPGTKSAKKCKQLKGKKRKRCLKRARG